MKKPFSISFKEVTFGFDGKPVLEDFSFEAAAGKHTVLRGESGSGKSTILKLLLGFHKPLSGSIFFNYEKWSPQIIRHNTAWLPQDLNIGKGTVQEVMTKPYNFAQNKNLANTERIQKNTLGKLGVQPEVWHKTFRNLSTGQRQRIGIAICHLLGKPLLLLDEPTSALDHASKQKAATLLADKDRTVISTSHDPFWVDRADNIIDLTLWK